MAKTQLLEKERQDLADNVKKILKDIEIPTSNPPALKTKEKSAEKSQPKKGVGIPYQRGKVFDFSKLPEFDVQDIAHDPTFDFDQLFDTFVELEKQKSLPYLTKLLPELKKKISKIEKLQQTLPALIPNKDLAIKDYVKEIYDIIVEEFVTPGLSVGQKILPTVWQGLAQVKSQTNPSDFNAAMKIVWGEIRKSEYAILAKIVGISVETEPTRLQPQPQLQPAINAITKITKKYLEFVMQVSQQNKKNLAARLIPVRKVLGDQNFKIALLKAFEESKKVEDKAFKKWLT
jgi:hypothetical protein